MFFRPKNVILLGWTAQPWGDKKFATLDQAQKFACDKVTDKNTVVASLCDNNNVYHVGPIYVGPIYIDCLRVALPNNFISKVSFFYLN